MAEDQSVNNIKIVVFQIDDEEYALPVESVSEVINFSELISIPNSPEFILGFMNLRGNVIVVIDLLKKFGLKLDQESQIQTQLAKIVVIEIGENKFGVLADRVLEVLQISLDKIQKTPQVIIDKISENYLRGIIVLEEEIKLSSDQDNMKILSINGQEKQDSTSRMILLLEAKDFLKENENIKDLVQTVS